MLRRAAFWLLPLCTVLAVTAAAVLPQRLSQARDGEYFGQVHAEEAKDKLFSPAADLVKRLELLVRWQQGSGEKDSGLVFSRQLLPTDMSKWEDTDEWGYYSLMAHSSNLEERAVEALRALAEEIPPLQEVIPETMEGLAGERVTIYSEESIVANFITFDWHEEPDWDILMYLDETMEKVVLLVLSSPRLMQDQNTAWDTTVFTDFPRQYLDYLGLKPGSRRVGPQDSFLVNVEGANLRYIFFYQWEGGVLSIFPDMLEEEEGSSAPSREGGEDKDGKKDTVIREYRTNHRERDTDVTYATP